jgi:DNA-binding NarL/FixJ family response regulator
VALDWRGNTNVVEPDMADTLHRQQLQPDSLTWRERQILRLVAQGYASGEVATLLGISAKTVDTYRTRIMEKLNVHSRAELTRFALEYGYLIVA